MNDNDYEMIGESIWDTYRNMASILAEAGLVGPEVTNIFRRNRPKAILARRARKKGPEGRREEGSERSEKGRIRKGTMMAATTAAIDKTADNI